MHTDVAFSRWMLSRLVRPGALVLGWSGWSPGRFPQILRRWAWALLVLGQLGSAGFTSLRADEERVIYPRTPAATEAPAAPAPSSANTSLLFLALAAAGAGGWLLWRQRQSAGTLSGKDGRKLAITETRGLGNRQYLVVAEYDGRKFLLGVCPGRIDLLAPLDGSAPPPRAP